MNVASHFCKGNPGDIIICFCGDASNGTPSLSQELSAGPIIGKEILFVNIC